MSRRLKISPSGISIDLTGADVGGVPSIADLPMDPSSGAVLFTADVKDLWVAEEASTLVPDGITIVAYTGIGSPAGNWVRLEIPNLFWAFQGSWGFDAVAGSDRALGTPAAPLKTWAEFRRRTNNATFMQGVVNSGNPTWSLTFPTKTGAPSVDLRLRVTRWQ